MKETKQLLDDITVTIEHAQSNTPKYILYLHGGGLIYGSKNDLPHALKNRFLDQGYTILSLDYLLAPNTSVAEIIETLNKSFSVLGKMIIQEQPFGICGRSAGSYLMFHLTKHLGRNKEITPNFLINFYGYTDFEFLKKAPSPTERTLTAEVLTGIDQETPLADDPLMTRALLYHYGQQQGILADYYGLPKSQDWSNYAIREEELADFPPCFSTASTTDQEVPFASSKRLSKQIPDSRFKPVYDLEHDFLKQTSEPQVQTVLKELSDWLSAKESF
ncbi:alpha/beta hydrolase [Enterococcus sp. DIV1298c]|uniref:alpha/beta hydrolase n=1 Tax=Enterococcus sp. DIV1298c TaxID=2815328 RepID=UPI001A938AF9|nr:alpha/beta hydrolase [Enterococcus sp. DIV1298c]MBO0460266.1 alpha/beta hydrolase [Enterococcus sp. DIV1298c]